MSIYRSDFASPGWFKVGRVDVTSTILAVALGVFGLLSSVVAGAALPNVLYFEPRAIMAGQWWRLITWPFADTISLWSVLNLVMLWYFGRDLEERLGRHRMAALLGGIALVLMAAHTVVGLTISAIALGGMGMVELCVLLLWIAEWPTRRFFFNIPAWGFGAFLVGLQVLTMITARLWGALLALLVSLALTAILARYIGLLSDYNWIPGKRVAKRVKVAQPSRAERREAERRVNDDHRMDELLAKISSQGIHSLTKAERAELDKMRERRRQG